MASFVVLEPPGRAGTEASSGAAFVRDGFRLLGFLVPPIWLLANRLWLEALLAVALGLCLAAAAEAMGVGMIAPALSLLIGLYVGLEGPGLKIAALRRRGWIERGVVEADDVAEAEIRYYAGAVDEDDMSAASGNPWTPRAAALRPAHQRPAPMLGLTGYPGGR
jgi:hypothetical protein